MLKDSRSKVKAVFWERIRVLVSFLFVAIILGQSLLADDITQRIVNVKQNEAENAEGTKSNNNHLVSYTVTVSPIANEIRKENDQTKTNEEYYKDSEYEKKRIDCTYSPSFSDLVACESLNIQSSVDSSTIGILWATIAAATFSVLASIAAAISVIFVWKSLKESRRVNTLQLQPWLNIGRPTISRHIGRISSVQASNTSFFRIEFPITNDGKTPVKGLKIELRYLYVELKNTEGGKTLLKSTAYSQERTMPLNPSVSSSQIIVASCSKTIKYEHVITGDFSGDDVEICMNMEVHIRFIDISTAKDRLRRIRFVFDTIHHDETVDQFRVFDAIEEADNSYFVGDE